MKKETSGNRSESPCIRCDDLCCKYITVKIPAPRTIRDFDGLLWQLSHKDVQAFKDTSGWHLLICNPCIYLSAGGGCAIYERRPITCREHSIEQCEYQRSIAKTAALFFDGAKALDRFCKKKFKTWDRRF